MARVLRLARLRRKLFASVLPRLCHADVFGALIGRIAGDGLASPFESAENVSLGLAGIFLVGAFGSLRFAGSLGFRPKPGDFLAVGLASAGFAWAAYSLLG